MKGRAEKQVREERGNIRLSEVECGQRERERGRKRMGGIDRGDCKGKRKGKI